MEKVGYLCTFTPKELIWAAGFQPVRILALNQPVSLANSHLQSYSCSQARGSLERMLKGELNFYGVIFTRSCDTLMRLADIWEKNLSMRVYNFEFPTKLHGSSIGFLRRELYDLKSTLEGWSGKEIEVEELVSSIKLYGELEKTLNMLFEVQPDYELLLKAQTQNPIEVLEESTAKLEELGRKEELKSRLKSKKALVTGSVCPFPGIMRLISDSGFTVIDDLCTGSRFFTFDVEYAGINSIENSVDGAIDFLAKKYFQKAPCPTKNYQNKRRCNFFRFI